MVASAQHYGLFKDLFQSDFFRPVVDLKVNYQGKRVFYGNKIEAKHVSFIKKNKLFYLTSRVLIFDT